MDADAADEPRLAEAQMAPGAAGIGRFVNAVAIGYVEPDLGFPGAGIDHVGVQGATASAPIAAEPKKPSLTQRQ
jgi:hypothetical protein